MERVIVKQKRNNCPQVVVLINNGQKNPPQLLGQSFGVVFLCLDHYLINVNTNVSNARMNIPKAIRSLKSNFLFISTTPILCKIKQRSATLQHNCSIVCILSYLCKYCNQGKMFWSVYFSIKRNVNRNSIKTC